MEFGLFQKFDKSLSREDEQKLKEKLNQTESIIDDRDVEIDLIKVNPEAKKVEEKMQIDLGIKEGLSTDPEENQKIENRMHPNDPESVFGELNRN